MRGLLAFPPPPPPLAGAAASDADGSVAGGAVGGIRARTDAAGPSGEQPAGAAAEMAARIQARMSGGAAADAAREGADGAAEVAPASGRAEPSGPSAGTAESGESNVKLEPGKAEAEVKVKAEHGPPLAPAVPLAPTTPAAPAASAAGAASDVPAEPTGAAAAENEDAPVGVVAVGEAASGGAALVARPVVDARVHDRPRALADRQAAVMPTLAPLVEAGGRHDVQFISQGELRLADFKQLLARSGLQSEFAEGSLIVNARVTVRKQGARELTVEGPFCADYLRVQELLYSQFQTV